MEIKGIKWSIGAINKFISQSFVDDIMNFSIEVEDIEFKLEGKNKGERFLQILAELDVELFANFEIIIEDEEDKSLEDLRNINRYVLNQLRIKCEGYGNYSCDGCTRQYDNCTDKLNDIFTLIDGGKVGCIPQYWSEGDVTLLTEEASNKGLRLSDTL